MMCYSAQPANRFLSFAEIKRKNLGKNISKNLTSKIVRNFLIILNNLPQMHSKLLQKDQFKKQQSQLVI